MKYITKKILILSLAGGIALPTVLSSCASKKSGMEKRINKQKKKQKKTGDNGCPIKDC